jgi:hypothetical protein
MKWDPPRQIVRGCDPTPDEPGVIGVDGGDGGMVCRLHESPGRRGG